MCVRELIDLIVMIVLIVRIVSSDLIVSIVVNLFIDL